MLQIMHSNRYIQILKTAFTDFGLPIPSEPAIIMDPRLATLAAQSQTPVHPQSGPSRPNHRRTRPQGSVSSSATSSVSATPSELVINRLRSRMDDSSPATPSRSGDAGSGVLGSGADSGVKPAVSTPPSSRLNPAAGTFEPAASTSAASTPKKNGSGSSVGSGSGKKGKAKGKGKKI